MSHCRCSFLPCFFSLLLLCKEIMASRYVYYKCSAKAIKISAWHRRMLTFPVVQCVMMLIMDFRKLTYWLCKVKWLLQDVRGLFCKSVLPLYTLDISGTFLSLKLYCHGVYVTQNSGELYIYILKSMYLSYMDSGYSRKSDPSLDCLLSACKLFPTPLLFYLKNPLVLQVKQNVVHCRKIGPL